MITLSTIKRLHSVIERSITRIDAPLKYDRVVDALTVLGRAINEYNGDNDDLRCIGEFSSASLDSLIVGAYWHLTEWHAGQWSDTYAAMCALGSVFSPGMTSGPEPESSEQDIYDLLNELAELNNKATA